MSSKITEIFSTQYRQCQNKLSSYGVGSPKVVTRKTAIYLVAANRVIRTVLPAATTAGDPLFGQLFDRPATIAVHASE